MATKVYYLFCETCGADTACYERMNTCPYCHKEGLRVIGDSEETDSTAIQATIVAARATWMASHRPIGKRSRRPFFRRA